MLEIWETGNQKPTRLFTSVYKLLTQETIMISVVEPLKAYSDAGDSHPTEIQLFLVPIFSVCNKLSLELTPYTIC